jgi:hypothetical protein
MRVGYLERALQRQPNVTDIADPLFRILVETSLNEGKKYWRERGRQRGPVGSCSRMRAKVSVSVSPSNARRPVSISNSTQPKAQMSVRLSTG